MIKVYRQAYNSQRKKSHISEYQLKKYKKTRKFHQKQNLPIVCWFWYKMVNLPINRPNKNLELMNAYIYHHAILSSWRLSAIHRCWSLSWNDFVMEIFYSIYCWFWEENYSISSIMIKIIKLITIRNIQLMFWHKIQFCTYLLNCDIPINREKSDEPTLTYAQKNAIEKE